MAYDLELGNRIREAVKRKRRITEKNMFGGLAFMVDGRMFCGVIKDKMVIRVDPEKNEEYLSKPFTSQMDFTGKPMKGYIYIDKEGLTKNAAIIGWINEGLIFTRALPEKKEK